jgi:Alpha/beta hydrolase family
MLMEDPAATARMICQDIPAEEGTAVVRNFAKHSAQSFGNELTYAGYENIPSSYLLCEEDQAGPPDFQREMIGMIEKASGRRVDVTHINAGHCPYLSAEKGTVDWVIDVAKKAGEGR